MTDEEKAFIQINLANKLHLSQACASVWIATSFRPRPRMHKRANIWWSLPQKTRFFSTKRP